MTAVAEHRLIPEVNRVLLNLLVLLGGDPEKYSGYFTPQIKLVRHEPEFVTLQGEGRIKEVTMSYAFGLSDDLLVEEDVAISLFNCVLGLIKKIGRDLREAPSFPEIFGDMKQLLERMVPSLPSSVSELASETLEIVSQCQPKKPLTEGKKKPFILPMMEPKFEAHHQAKDPAKERKKLARKYKREFKGAQRELKKDSQFMRQTWLQETLRNDAERKRKVKELIGDLASDQRLFKKKR
jgi:nucleolar protein 14